VKGEQKSEAADSAVPVCEEVGGLGDPVGGGAAGELDAGVAVEVGQQRLRGVAVVD
jgi:hypothetical protein